ncbi:HAD-IC family P-type ATPase [Pyrodictium occultum]|uniref:HAD-IC family P-type ATPase n=1 Tax=Pyrodictium occultum TaxID=2309 RepID=UPI0014434FE6|nr:HAD-IC family P-type ATPase [Pyrodictium occultum]
MKCCGFLHDGWWLALLILGLLVLSLSLLGLDQLAWFILAAVAAGLLARFTVMLARGRVTVDLLMGLSVLVMLKYGLTSEAALVATLYAASEILEDAAEEAAERRLTSLRELLPRTALVRRGNVEKVHIDEVKPGDVIIVPHGGMVPLDSMLLSEEAVFDTSMVTGEHEPRRLTRGDPVESGYMNIGGMAVGVRAVKPARESAIQLLVREALETLEKKTRHQRLIERIAPWYIGLLLASYAAASAILGPERSLVFLLAGCPSAYIVVSSYTYMLVLGQLARRGVVVRSPRASRTPPGPGRLC